MVTTGGYAEPLMDGHQKVRMELEPKAHAIIPDEWSGAPFVKISVWELDYVGGFTSTVVKEALMFQLGKGRTSGISYHPILLVRPMFQF